MQRTCTHKLLDRGRPAAELGSSETFTVMKTIVIALVFAANASAAALEEVARITGTFSSLAYNDESGDLGGMEISIVYGGGNHYAVVQCSEGSPGIPFVAEIQVQGSRIRFTLPKDSASGCPEATYNGIVSSEGLRGQFAGLGEPELLRRKSSYWQ